MTLLTSALYTASILLELATQHQLKMDKKTLISKEADQMLQDSVQTMFQARQMQ